MKYKNIIFDVGGVLLSYRWIDLIKETQPDETEARAFAKRLFNDPLWLEFDIGLRPFDDIIEDYVIKYPSDEKHIRYALGHLERMPIHRPKVWEKVHELKQAGYRLYILSNYSHRMFRIHTEGLPFHDDMDGRIVSYEVHHLKPHKEIYEDLFKKYGLKPEECLFFDDRQDNVDGGRKCGMEGRVIYSEEVLLGYLDRLLAPDGISNTFHDMTYSREERIDWLLSNMSLEEKVQLYSHPEKGVGRFGVEGFVLGGEASHGTEERNDQNGIGESVVTTSFPNPIGMSSSWNPGLIKQAGEVVGTEARAVWKRHRRTGLSRWAPTIDLERDPRWGRNEEGYGEDPYLTSENASAYVSGMQGNDPDYVRCGATLKHFYANNTEKDRFFSNSSIALRDKQEYYLFPFRQVLNRTGALGVMTAYNRINGIPGMLNPEVKTLLKAEYGLTHAVCDGFAMVRIRDYHHEYGTYAESMAESVRAGVDSMSDKPEDVEKAVRDALELSILSESELDGALKNILMVGMKLGIYDPDECVPFSSISRDDVDTEDAREICRRLSEESLVLLENSSNTLPLDKDKSEDIALIGPLADEWSRDWYMGIAPFGHSVKEGLSSLLGKDVPVENGLDTYKILSGDKAWHIEADGTISMSSSSDGAAFYIEDRGEGYFTIRSVENGKYVQSVFDHTDEAAIGCLRADKDDVFDWFVTCRFSICENKNGTVTIKDRFGQTVGIMPDGRLKAGKESETAFSFGKIKDGIEGALKASKDKETVILVLGCNPMVPAREDFDRTTLALPSGQQRLMDAMIASGKKIVTVLISNYPYTLNGAEKKTAALLLSSTGSEYMGDAIAAALFGEISPTGRLVQSWPVSDDVLPDIRDYEIIGKRTYRYISEGLMYPFGYGLSFSNIRYSDMSVYTADDPDEILISLNIRNEGSRITDEVVQIYATADFKDESLGDTGYGRRLIAFSRVKDIRPGETREIRLAAKKEPLMVYDVVRGCHMVYDGTYHLYAGKDSLHEAISCDIHISGGSFAERDLFELLPVYSCDGQTGVEYTKGAFGMTAAMVSADRSPQEKAVLTFVKCRIPDEAKKALLILKSDVSGEVELLWNEKAVGKWNGNTSSPEIPYNPYELPSEHTVMPSSWPSVWTETECPLEFSKDMDTEGTLKISLSGDVRLISVKMV